MWTPCTWVLGWTLRLSPCPEASGGCTGSVLLLGHSSGSALLHAMSLVPRDESLGCKTPSAPPCWLVAPSKHPGVQRCPAGGLRPAPVSPRGEDSSPSDSSSLVWELGPVWVAYVPVWLWLWFALCVFSAAAEAPFPSLAPGGCLFRKAGWVSDGGTQRWGRTSDSFTFPAVTTRPWWEQESPGSISGTRSGQPRAVPGTQGGDHAGTDVCSRHGRSPPRLSCVGRPPLSHVHWEAWASLCVGAFFPCLLCTGLHKPMHFPSGLSPAAHYKQGSPGSPRLQHRHGAGWLLDLPRLRSPSPSLLR